LNIEKQLNNFLELQNDAVLKFGNKTANINIKNRSLSVTLTVMDQKPQKSLKR